MFLFVVEVRRGRIRGCVTAEITNCENDLQEVFPMTENQQGKSAYFIETAAQVA